MTHLVWSPQSVRDLEAIRAYVAADSERYADALVRRIIATVERLTAFPESGRIVPERESPEMTGSPTGSVAGTLAQWLRFTVLKRSWSSSWPPPAEHRPW